ncbi:MAG: hypothetical protein KDA75_10740 [Planctomycetaceae bacterium]|nr:hypothetical protein [Planctomycetaceae bacterium]
MSPPETGSIRRRIAQLRHAGTELANQMESAADRLLSGDLLPGRGLINSLREFQADIDHVADSLQVDVSSGPLWKSLNTAVEARESSSRRQAVLKSASQLRHRSDGDFAPLAEAQIRCAEWVDAGATVATDSSDTAADADVESALIALMRLVRDGDEMSGFLPRKQWLAPSAVRSRWRQRAVC